MNEIASFLNNYRYYFPLILFVFLVIRYFVISGGMYLILWKLFAKQFETRRIQTEKLQPNQIVTEVKHSLITFAAMSLATWPLFILYLEGKSAIYFDWNQHSVWWVPVGVFISLLWHDIYFYFSHRVLHKAWVFKRVHYIHHLSRVPTPFASHNFHWFEGVLQIIFIYPLVMFIPMHAWTFVFFMALTHFFATWGHFNYELMPFKVWNSWWGSWVTTSTHHNDHHRFHNHNYGLYLKRWDVMFKTLNVKTEKHFDEYKKR